MWPRSDPHFELHLHLLHFGSERVPYASVNISKAPPWISHICQILWERGADAFHIWSLHLYTFEMIIRFLIINLQQVLNPQKKCLRPPYSFKLITSSIEHFSFFCTLKYFNCVQMYFIEARSRQVFINNCKHCSYVNYKVGYWKLCWKITKSRTLSTY